MRTHCAIKNAECSLDIIVSNKILPVIQSGQLFSITFACTVIPASEARRESVYI